MDNLVKVWSGCGPYLLILMLDVHVHMWLVCQQDGMDWHIHINVRGVLCIYSVVVGTSIPLLIVSSCSIVMP